MPWPRLASLHCDVSPEQVLITNSCQEAITIALKLITKPGDTVALESPTYYGLLQVIEALGLKALERNKSSDVKRRRVGRLNQI